MRPPRQPHIEAEVAFLPTSEGGRSTSAKSGYRPNHLVLPDYLPSGHHEYRDKEQVLPGESAKTEIWFLSPKHYPKSMRVGKVIRVQEGSRLVGHAKVLKRSAPETKFMLLLLTSSASPNLPRQPTPGVRLGCSQAPVARRGCAHLR